MLKIDLQSFVKIREDLPKLINHLGLTGWGVEIGVWEGYFSEVILKNTNLSMLISIDAWSTQFIKKKWSQEQIDAAYQKTIDRLKSFQNRSCCWRMMSETAATLIPNESLDFVFIDASHNYEAVTQDLNLWWDKLKKGGVFSGHDFFHRQNANWGVVEAVTEFANQKSFDFNVTSETMPSWYTIKSS